MSKPENPRNKLIRQLWKDYSHERVKSGGGHREVSRSMYEQQFEAACIELLERVKNGEVKL